MARLPAARIERPERHHTSLLTADHRIERSGAQFTCPIITVAPVQGP
jgi:hypothetical protein